MNLIDALAIPHSALVDQRITKKLYYENVSMNISQKKLFKEELESLQFLYNIAPSTMNIPHFMNEEYHYDNIAVIVATLKSRKYATALAEIIHKVPYPVVLIMNSEDHTLLSLSPKRINRADNTKRTVESSISTEWIDTQNASEFETLFFESIDSVKLPFENLYRFYQALCERVIALQASRLSGAFSNSTDSDATQRILDEIRLIDSRMTELRNRLKKSEQFNEKIELNIEIKKLEESRENQLKILGNLS